MKPKRTVYIVVKEYSLELAKRQPWYSIRKLKEDFEVRGETVKVVADLVSICIDDNDIIIKVFGIKDLFLQKRSLCEYYYFLTFPIYPLRKIWSFKPSVWFENWHGLNRILLMMLIPRWFVLRALKIGKAVITISDRSREFLSEEIISLRYYPFIVGNWDNEKIANKSLSFDKTTVGYFGPPYASRYYDKVFNFFQWCDERNYRYQKKVVTRIERTELRDKEQRYSGGFQNDSNYRLVSGFLSRSDLTEELVEIDLLILPFRVLMSELPVVVLEALELGIPVVTTEDCGIRRIAENLQTLLVLEKFDESVYSLIVDFMGRKKENNFREVMHEIEQINTKTINSICER